MAENEELCRGRIKIVSITLYGVIAWVIVFVAIGLYIQILRKSKNKDIITTVPEPYPKPDTFTEESTIQVGSTVKKEKGEVYQKIEGFWHKALSFDYKDLFTNILSSRTRKENKQRKKNRSKIVLVNMEMNNGLHRHFQVTEDSKNGFEMNKKRYVFDLQKRYFIQDSDMYAYDFHESLSLPIKRVIPVKEILDTVKETKKYNVEYSLNPGVIHRFVLSEIAQIILQGGAIAKAIRIVLIIVVIVLAMDFAHFLFDVLDSGVFGEIIPHKK